MKIIIAGDGKVGLALTRLLSEEGHDLVTIDSNREVLERNTQLYDVMAVAGNCATMACKSTTMIMAMAKMARIMPNTHSIVDKE